MPEDAALLTLEPPGCREALGAARNVLTALNGNLQLVSDTTLRDMQVALSERVSNAYLHALRPALL